MPLPSQSGRSSTGARSPSSYGKRKGPGPRLIVVGLVVVAAVVVWLMLPSSQRDKMLTPGAASAGQGPATEVKRDTTPPPVVAPPETLRPPESVRPPTPLVEINQGRGGNTSGGSGDKSAASREPSTPVVAPEPTPMKPIQAEPKASPSAIDQVPSVAAARQKQSEGDLVTARVLFSKVLADGKLADSEEEAVREELTRINDDLVFSPRVIPTDPYSMVHKVQSGESLIKIAQKYKLAPDWRLIQRVNRMSSPSRISLGQSLKLVKGPFHAVVRKSKYRLDLYMGPADDESSWVFIRSFKVGLGEGNSTPAGTYIIKKASKLVDPYWVNPRTGERFESRDPKNPIGEYWMGLEGVGEAVAQSGYGIHGTIDPDSIGKQKSMGCVRLGNEDIALMFELLGEEVSMVRIEP